MNTNFYTILDCEISSSEKEICTNYKKKIKKLVNQLDNLNENKSSIDFNSKLQNIKNEIKLLKTSKFILINKDLRKKYNLILNDKDSMSTFSKAEYVNSNQIIESDALNSLTSNTASRRDLKLDFDKRSESLSNRVFQTFEFEQ